MNIVWSPVLSLVKCIGGLVTFFYFSLKDSTVKLFCPEVLESRASCSISTLRGAVKEQESFLLSFISYLCTYVSFRMTFMLDYVFYLAT